MLLSLVFAFSFFVFAESAEVNNTIYVTLNAESPSFGRPGSTPVGVRRAQNCIPALFQNLDVGKVISCPFNGGDGVCFSTTAIVTPLTQALNLTVDFSCGADENTDIRKAGKRYKGNYSLYSVHSVHTLSAVEAMDNYHRNANGRTLNSR
ncbi:hypothetical protein M422DRAFT_243959 [Sphaerobolus stellatus SS14]|nr:hypothetical protein M422DRAFT_243959 [Sphaerobolus stellatus SS14]